MSKVEALDASAFQTPATYRALANSLPLSLLIKSIDGRRVFANEAYLRWCGHSWKDVEGKTDDELFPPDIAASYRADDEAVIASGESLHSVEESVRPDGSVCWIERVKSPIRDHTGRMLGVQVMFWDVTGKIEAERKSQFEQRLLNTLLNNIPDSIYFKDLDSRFLRVSLAMAIKFGLGGPDEVHGRSDADIFTLQHARAAREDELRIMETGQPLVDRIERETWPDREDTWCLTTKMPLRNEAGEIVGTFGISRDISDLRRSEEALREAVRHADAANRAKSEFLANMSHEIRTPMNAMVGMSDLLAQTQLTEEQRDCVSVIRESAGALLRLINDILDFSKIEARRLELESVPFSLGKVVQGSLNTVRLQALRKGVNLVCRVNSELPDTYFGDPGRLRQVLVNLIGNAIKFTDEGTVTVQVDRNPQSDSSESNRQPMTPLLFSVIDTGIGIPESQQATVLDAFTQADASTTRRFGGTGLGLSISRQLVELMGGTLQLTSTVGVGTTFYFDLSLLATNEQPIVDEDDLEEDLGGDGEPMTSGVRILVAEDGVTNQHVISGLLKSLGHECSIASDGRETIARWNRESFDLILMDMHMPVMDGLEATRTIRQHELGTTQHIPIIALTAAAMSEDAEACREAGMDDFLTKPIHSRKLKRMLAKYVPSYEGTRQELTDDPSSAFDVAAQPSPQEGDSCESPVRSSDSSLSSSDLTLSARYCDCLDLDSARSRIPGGAAGVKRLAAVFRIECRQLVSQLTTQLEDANNNEARRSAHTLKGACGLLGAKRLQGVATEIETSGREQLLSVEDRGLALKLLADLRRESKDVLDALDELLNEDL